MPFSAVSKFAQNHHLSDFMSGIRDTATVTLNVNGAQAKQMMSDLEQKVSDTKKKISDLKAAMADPKDIEKARKELKAYEKQLDEEGLRLKEWNLPSATLIRLLLVSLKRLLGLSIGN